MQTAQILITREKLTKKDEARARAIGKPHDCTLIACDSLPGIGRQAWFTTQDYGSGATSATREALLSDLHAAGVKGW